jgi:carboxyl-terminal processing protease
MNIREEMSRSRRVAIPYPIMAVLITVAFAGGLYFGSTRSEAIGFTVFDSANSTQPEHVDFKAFWKAWNLIQERYVPATTTDPITDEDLVYGAIKGLADALGDPYTVFLPPQEAEVFSEDIRGNFEGVGMEIGIRDDSLVVVAPLKGTPAERAGIRSGDKILEISGESTDGMTVDAAVQRIRGERGTTVELVIQREGERELLTITIIRAVINIPTIETSVEEGVFVIRLFNFSAISSGLFRQALREFVQSEGKTLILDLRGNPGGFLEASVDMASWFLPTGAVVVSEDFGGDKEPRFHRSKGYDIFTDQLKMVILVDRGSASASEILAGALREHDVAILIGESTFGKGSVQELLDVTSNTALKITIARWLTPKGNSISDGGLIPDIVVPVTSDDIAAGHDPQLERALEYLKK